MGNKTEIYIQVVISLLQRQLHISLDFLIHLFKAKTERSYPQESNLRPSVPPRIFGKSQEKLGLYRKDEFSKVIKSEELQGKRLLNLFLSSPLLNGFDFS